jgi:hypothetical protein
MNLEDIRNRKGLESAIPPYQPHRHVSFCEAVRKHRHSRDGLVSIAWVDVNSAAKTRSNGSQGKLIRPQEFLVLELGLYCLIRLSAIRAVRILQIAALYS